MNRLFVETASRGDRTGALAKLGLAGSPSLDTGHARRERLAGALNELEAAQRSGDNTAVAICEHRLDRAVEESRAARKPDAGEGAGQPQPGWDGGVRQRRSPPQPGFQQESAASIFVRAMQTSKQERAERDADTGTTIFAKGV
jgi:hypothetical protein